MRAKFLASVVAALSLTFVPTMAQAVATTLDLQSGGSAAVDLVAGDTLDVTVSGPIAKTGPAVHELYSTWSTQSLNLISGDLTDPAADITWPEGWSLEYTTDGTNWIDWAVTEPTDANDIIAIRSRGDVNTVGENTFKTTSTGSVDAVSFAGSGGGDGYNVAIGDNKVFNMYHHQEGIATVQCHTFSGDLCETSEVAVEGYSTNHASSVYSDDASGKVYGFVMRDSDSHFGVLCFDFSVEPAVDCGFDELETVGADLGLEYPYQDLGSSSQDGNIIWSITGNGGELLCYNIATGAACADNAWDTGLTDYAFDTGRVTAVDGLVYYTLGDKFACFDPATNGRCAGSGNHTLTDTANRMPPLPVEDSSGNLLGACDAYTEYCIDDQGSTFAFPTALSDYFDAFPVNWDTASQNAEQFAYDADNNRFYFETINDAYSWGSNTITCYDFEIGDACVGFNGFIDDTINFYTATIDSQIANCVWINGDAGSIYPLDATTGEIGCDLGDPTVSLPYDAVTPRMSCGEDGRVTEWESIVVAPLDGVTMSDVRVSFYDSEGYAVDGYTDLTPNAGGLISLTGLDVNATGVTPTIKITAGDITDELAEQIAATVTFVAEDPQLCFALDASDNCETTISPDPGVGDIADGIVKGTSITRPTHGTAVGNTESTTLPGQNAAEMCAASALTIELPAQLASTGVDAGGIAIAGFAVLAVGGAAVVATRRRKA